MPRNASIRSKTLEYDAVLVWDNLGPIHIDRLNSTQNTMRCLALELYASSHEYKWQPDIPERFSRVTISAKRNGTALDWGRFLGRLFHFALGAKSRNFFLCHYERPYIFLLAILLRMRGRNVFVMQDSKFDDYERTLWKECFKRFYYAPYHAALVGSPRTAEYVRFLGIKRSVIGYNSSDTRRIQSLKPAEMPRFEDRNFVVLARMIQKKNLPLAIKAFDEYRRITGDTRRRLVFVGDGPEMQKLKSLGDDLGLGTALSFVGWCQEPEAMTHLSTAVALLLPSTEEQFGNVVGEACSLGIPVIISSNCGAADLLVRPFLNGFALAPVGVDSWARAMAFVADNEGRWEGMSHSATEVALERWDSSNFARAANDLIAWKDRTH